MAKIFVDKITNEVLTVANMISKKQKEKVVIVTPTNNLEVYYGKDEEKNKT